jgi:hypothetical protein
MPIRRAKESASEIDVCTVRPLLLLRSSHMSIGTLKWPRIGVGPLSRTSSRDFVDREPGVLLLVLLWALGSVRRAAAQYRPADPLRSNQRRRRPIPATPLGWHAAERLLATGRSRLLQRDPRGNGGSAGPQWTSALRAWDLSATVLHHGFRISRCSTRMFSSRCWAGDGTAPEYSPNHAE